MGIIINNIKKIKENKFFWIFSITIFLIMLIIIPNIYAELQPIESIELFSEKLNFNNQENGAWKIKNSVKWSSSKEAFITMDLDTVTKSVQAKDVLLVLETSSAVSDENFESIKNATNNFVSNILKNENSKVGLISFNSTSNLEVDLCNDKEVLINSINSLESKGNNSYYKALISLQNFLDNYKKEDSKDLDVIFIINSFSNLDIANEEVEYNYLKNKYPFLSINAIQFEMGSTILEPIKKISDNQLVADKETINDMLISLIEKNNYEDFKIIETINKNYFSFNEDDININCGDISFQNNQVTWDLGEYVNDNAQMTIKVKLKDNLSNGNYPINDKIEVNSSIFNVDEEIVSLKTPVLGNNYKVSYFDNAPKGCNIDDTFKEMNFSVFDTVEISSSAPKCDGYQFKGWDITNKDVVKLNDDYFVMPSEDVNIVANWSKIDVTKSMDGEISEVHTLYKQVEQDVNDASKYAKKYTGDTSSFKGNNNVYYYYGQAANNNVIFGNYCWKIVRTTDTGGVKLLYNGVPSGEGTCNNTRTAAALTKEQMNVEKASLKYNVNANSLADSGYMFNLRYVNSNKEIVDNQVILSNMSMSSDNYYYADSYEFEDGMYYLSNPILQSWYYNYQDLVGKYTCRSTTENGSCASLYYIVKAEANKMYYISLNDGNGINDKGYEETITISDEVIDNGNGFYTLSNPLTIEKKDWSTNYSMYNNYYTCGNNDISCSEIKYITKTNTTSISYLNRNPYKYGNTFRYENGKYNLIDTKDVWNFSSEYNDLNYNHYTCFNSDGVCENIYYIYYFTSNKIYYLELENGKSIEDVLDDMLYGEDVNKNNSNIKEAIDNWYKNNMLEFTSFLEDTVWCNDRSMNNQSSNGWNPNGGSLSTGLYFNSYGNSSDLNCPNLTDRFTVSSSNGNGALEYPTGLITVQEQNLAYTTKSPLGSSSYYWGLSPHSFNYYILRGYGVGNTGNISGAYVNSNGAVRPAISLKAGITYLNGDGSVNSPYIIDTL